MLPRQSLIVVILGSVSALQHESGIREKQIDHEDTIYIFIDRTCLTNEKRTGGMILIRMTEMRGTLRGILCVSMRIKLFDCLERVISSILP